MPFKSNKPNLKKPWRASAKRDGTQYSLGYYATKTTATTVEDNFNKKFPKAKNRRGKNQKEGSE